MHKFSLEHVAGYFQTFRFSILASPCGTKSSSLEWSLSEYWIRWKFETFSGDSCPLLMKYRSSKLSRGLSNPLLLESTILFLKCTNGALGYSLDLCSANKRGFPPNANKRGGNPLSGHCIEPTPPPAHIFHFHWISEG